MVPITNEKSQSINFLRSYTFSLAVAKETLVEICVYINSVIRLYRETASRQHLIKITVFQERIFIFSNSALISVFHPRRVFVAETRLM